MHRHLSSSRQPHSSSVLSTAVQSSAVVTFPFRQPGLFPRTFADVQGADHDLTRGIPISLFGSDYVDWFKGDSPWGGAIATLSGMTGAMRLNPEGRGKGTVGLFGAFELRNINGPVKIEHPYRASGKIVYVGSSPRTEYWWYDACLDEKDGGK